jgi:glutathione S-transferase
MSPMLDAILHQYPASPFSEKVRLIMGFKGLRYRWVHIPTFPPRPDAVALTGGYRRTPFLQVGCDVYCDTRLIAAVIERHAPEPPLFPAGHEASASAVAQWADQILFPCTTPYAFKPEALARMAGDVPQEQAQDFLQDRMAMTKEARVRPLGRTAFDHMPAYLQQLEAQLASRAYLVTDAPTIADFAVYHCMWFLNRGVPELLEPRPGIRAWLERMAAIGHGTPSEVSSSDALEICRGATPAELGESLPASDNGAKLGDGVQVSPIDYGHEPTVGELIHLAPDEVVIRRKDARAGTVHVHFPRVGFQLKPASTAG